MKKKNGYIVNKIIVVNCIFEVFLKATDNDVSYNNKTSYCMAQNSFTWIVTDALCLSWEVFCKRKANPELSLFPAEGLESNFSPTVLESFDKSWLWNKWIIVSSKLKILQWNEWILETTSRGVYCSLFSFVILTIGTVICA